ncbi:MAG: cysteine hydrolase family protein [Phycisphaerae bacterium]
MIARRSGEALECVVVDLNTQWDLCDPHGARPVANLVELLPALRRVIAWTRWNHVPVISSMAARRACELASGGGRPYCVDGSPGQRKLPFTIFPGCARIEADNTLDVPIDLFRRYQQVVFRKRGNDLLGNPKADRFITQLPVREFILFGNGMECSIKALALGLIARDRRVTIVRDACGYWVQGAADFASRQINAKGARLITVDELLKRRLQRHHRYGGHRSYNTSGELRPGAAACNGVAQRRSDRERANHRLSARTNGRLPARDTGATMPSIDAAADGRGGTASAADGPADHSQAPSNES